MPDVAAGTQRLTSTIARRECAGRAVYVKQYTDGDWGRSASVVQRRASREVGLIALLHESGLFGRRLGIMNIVSADPEQATLVTAEIPGVTLDSVVNKRTRNLTRDGLQAMYLAGRWLRQFQQLKVEQNDGEQISDLDPACLVEYCKLRVSSLGDYGHAPLPATLCDSILKTLCQLTNQSNEDDERRVWSHADYTPGNIIWDGFTITPIDFAMAHADRPLLDVTYFIHRLEMQRVYRPWKHWPIDTWKSAFLRGYGRIDAESSPMYQALMIQHAICRLHTYSRRPSRDLKQRLHDGWVRMVLKQRLKHAAETFAV